MVELKPEKGENKISPENMEGEREDDRDRDRDRDKDRDTVIEIYIQKVKSS